MLTPGMKSLIIVGSSAGGDDAAGDLAQADT